MTQAELKCAETRMQQQWHDLVMAEQQGASLDVLEQMYDTYILLAEEYNRCSEEYQSEALHKSSAAAKRKRITRPISSRKEDEHVKLAS